MFKFVDRKESKNLVLISGWAFDYRIFEQLDLPYNYFLFRDNSPTNFEDELKDMLTKNNIDKISLLGWSKGAFSACDFAYKYPQAVDELILAGVRKKYKKDSLEYIKGYLRKNASVFLHRFYKECFSKTEKEQYSWFKKTLLKDYLRNTDADKLIEGLDQLAEKSIEPDLLKEIKNIKIVHGTEDKVAPFDQASTLFDTLDSARLIIFQDTGHIPFLRTDFKQRLYE